jgi:glyoxylase-like metal-dependent hydrolase (beta-lactamase superfamily II)
VEVSQIHPRVFRIGARMNMGGGLPGPPNPMPKGGGVGLYLIKGKRCALVDTGVHDSPEMAIIPALAEQGLGPKDVDFVLNTHGHADHAGGNAAFQSVSRARFLISKRELPVLLGGSEQARAAFFSPLREVFDSQQFQAKLDDNVRNSGGSSRIDQFVDDGDTVDLGEGIELKVVSLPGHTPGCVGYLWEKEGILFAGDAMGGSGSRPGSLPIIYDPEAYRESANKLLKVPLEMCCFAHSCASFGLQAQSIRTRPDIRTFVEESAYVNDQLQLAANRAVQAEPNASLQRQGERLLKELPAKFEPLPLREIIGTLWAAMGVFSFIWKARSQLSST